MQPSKSTPWPKIAGRSQGFRGGAAGIRGHREHRYRDRPEIEERFGGGLGGLGALLQRAHGTPAGACSGLHAPALGSGGRHCGPSPGAKRRAARLSAARSSACDACRPVLLPLGRGVERPHGRQYVPTLVACPASSFSGFRQNTSCTNNRVAQLLNRCFQLTQFPETAKRSASQPHPANPTTFHGNLHCHEHAVISSNITAPPLAANARAVSGAMPAHRLEACDRLEPGRGLGHRLHARPGH